MLARRDVVRNRERVLRAAADLRGRGQALQLNAVAREAGLGVGTVYRHFGDVQQLTEALVLHRFAELEAQAREIRDAGDLRTFLTGALGVLVADADFAAVATAPDPALADTSAARASLVTTLADAIDRAWSAAPEPSPLTPQDVLVLLCGLAYAVRRSGASGARAELYLETVLGAVLPAPAGQASAGPVSRGS